MNSIAAMHDEEQRVKAESLLQVVGEKFVSGHWKRSLLHIATSNNTDIKLLENLLEWGADKVIN